uniref:Uncharacterized protein n=1 Tax=viral metagenome TaxID=1070528 RepID=A0A6H1ZG77_9ZZZZ
MRELKILSDEKILFAWNNFPERTFDHEPTYDDILLLRLVSVANAQVQEDRKALKENDGRN